MSTHQTLIEKQSALIAKYQQELERLNVALAFQELWPEAFACGPVTPSWRANGYGDLQRLELRRPDGESREFSLDQLPGWLAEHGQRYVDFRRASQ